MSARVVVVGAGHAAGAFAAALRQGGYAGVVTLVGAEPMAPYQRPPLSKAWLKGETTVEELLVRPMSFYADKSVELRLSTVVESIDRTAQRIVLAGGTTIEYEQLVLATGSRLRALDVPDIAGSGVFELRSVADADRIKAAVGPGKRLVVVGGGYIGLEVAASARAIGAEVTVVEREARLLARVASETLSAFFARCHAGHGVSVLLSASVAAFERSAGVLTGVRLADGRVLDCDVAIVGIGALANDALALAAGLDCDDGVVVDQACRTSAAAIHAIGDCTRRPVPRYERTVRLESVPNALEQARAAAADICGRPEPKPEVPWFWSDQYDVRLQIAGLPFDVARQVVRGDPAGGSFAVFHLDDANRLQALEAVNASAEFVAARQWVASGQVIDPLRAADSSIAVKQIALPAAPAGSTGSAG